LKLPLIEEMEFWKFRKKSQKSLLNTPIEIDGIFIINLLLFPMAAHRTACGKVVILEH